MWSNQWTPNPKKKEGWFVGYRQLQVLPFIKEKVYNVIVIHFAMKVVIICKFSSFWHIDNNKINKNASIRYCIS